MMLFACLAVHLLLARVMASPWWVPDLTLAGLVLAVALNPRRWLVWSSLAAGAATIWAARWSGQVFAAYWLSGLAARLAVGRWDAANRFVQMVLVAVLASVVTVTFIWLEDLWSLRLLAAAGLRVLLTVLCVPAIRSARG